MSGAAITGIAAIVLAIALIVAVVVLPSNKVPLQRLNPDAPPPEGALTRAAGAVTDAVGKGLERRGTFDIVRALDEAGIKQRPQDFTFLVLVGCVVAGAFGLVLANWWVGVACILLVPVVTVLVLNTLTSRRRQAFQDQLDDTLQLMASSLRAGHSLPQSLDAISKEGEEPTSEEFARVTNESRVGRDLGVTLAETAQRMNSQDFLWVTQAIAINRQAGGNLAEVLDGVAHTIRERNQIRRQVKALSAEGKLSAIILMLLPVVVGGFVFLTNPTYIMKLTDNIIGWAMLGFAGILYLVGGLWMRKVIQVQF